MAIESTESPKYQIFLYFDGKEYVAEVPELPGCVGRGWSYAAALAGAEKAVADFISVAKAADIPLPVPSQELRYWRPMTERPQKGPAATVGHLLRMKYGRVALESLARRVGAQCSKTAFSSALGGAGSRNLRVMIALALGIPPSQLWPNRSFVTRSVDDQEYRRLSDSTASRQGMVTENAASRAI